MRLIRFHGRGSGVCAPVVTHVTRVTAGGNVKRTKSRYVTLDETQDPSVIKKMLRKYVKRRFQPRLDRISEAANSALER